MPTTAKPYASRRLFESSNLFSRMVTIVARERSVDRPRTPWTDANGNIRDEYVGAFEFLCRDTARKAGIPPILLHLAGWNGDETSDQGLFMDLVYRLGDLGLKTTEDAVNDILRQMATLCAAAGVEPKAAMAPVFDYARFIRLFNEGNGYWPRRAESDEAFYDEDQW